MSACTPYAESLPEERLAGAVRSIEHSVTAMRLR